MAQILETLKTFLESTGFARLIALGDAVEVLKVIAMFAIVCVLVYLAIAKKFEPLLLLPIAIGMLLGNLPGTEMFHMNLFISEDTSVVIADVQNVMIEEGYYVGEPTALTEDIKLADVLSEMHTNLVGAKVIDAEPADFAKIEDGSQELVDLLLSYKDAIYAADADGSLGSDKAITLTIESITLNSDGLDWDMIVHNGGLLDLLYLGVKLGIYPCLIFMGIGAMTDFAPLIANPKSLLLGASAQLGVFAAFFGALFLGFNPQEAASIGIIGGADGPTAILVTKTLAPHLLGAIAIAAYSYMALIPMIQPPIMKLLTSKKDRKIVMGAVRPVSKLEKILFPIVVTFTVVLIVPDAGPLVGCLMFGNLLTTCGVTDRISKTAQNELMNIVTIFLGITVGATATASNFLSLKTIFIILLGLTAFMLSTAGGLIGGNIMCKLTGGKVNPLIGSAGVSAVPMAARVAQIQGQKENPANYLLMHAMGPNVAGVIGSAVAAGFLLANFA